MFFFKVKSKHLDHTTILATCFQYSRAPKNKKVLALGLTGKTGNVAMCLLPQGTLDFSMEKPLLLEFLGFFFSPADVNFIGIQEFSQTYTCRNNKSQSFPFVAIVHLEMLLSIYVCFSVCVA